MPTTEAREADEAGYDAAAETYVVFAVDDGTFALPVANVQRTLPLPPLTRVPSQDPAILGVFQHAGRIITTWDARRWFQAGNDPPDEPWLLILDHHGRARAVLVDRVIDVLGIPGGRTEPVARPPAGVPADAVLGRLVAPELADEPPLPPDEEEPGGLDRERAERRARRLAAATLAGLPAVHVLALDALLPEVAA